MRALARLLVRAVGLDAVGVEVERVFGNGETALLGDLVLALFDFRVEKLFDFAALHAHQMVVVIAFVEFKDGLAGFEIVAFEQAGLFELGQHAVDGGEANVDVFAHEVAVHIFSRHVAGAASGLCFLEQVQNLQARGGGLEADIFEFL